MSTKAVIELSKEDEEFSKLLCLGEVDSLGKGFVWGVGRNYVLFHQDYQF